MSMMAALAERAAPLRRGLPAVHRTASAVRRVPVLGRIIDWLRLDFAGSVVGTFFFCWSLTPSLLPRIWYYQALVTGVTAVIGYAIGTLFGVLIRLIYRRVRRGRPLSRRTVVTAWAGFGVGGTSVGTWYLFGSARWQSDLRDLMDVDSPRLIHYVLILVVSFIIFTGFLALGRLLRGVSRWLGAHLSRWVPIPVAVVTSALLVAAISVWSWTGLFYPWMLGVANNAFAAINQETQAGESPPEIGTHAGGKKACWGHTMAIDPWGHIIAQASDQVGYISARLDRAYIGHIRSSLGSNAAHPVPFSVCRLEVHQVPAHVDVLPFGIAAGGASLQKPPPSNERIALMPSGGEDVQSGHQPSSPRDHPRRTTSVAGALCTPRAASLRAKIPATIEG
jgi:hypothetical protein